MNNANMLNNEHNAKSSQLMLIIGKNIMYIVVLSIVMLLTGFTSTVFASQNKMHKAIGLQWKKLTTKMNWKTAKIKCKSIQMRVLNKGELKRLIQTGVKSRSIGCNKNSLFCNFWANGDYLASEAYSVNIFVDASGALILETKTTNNMVLCVR